MESEEIVRESIPEQAYEQSELNIRSLIETQYQLTYMKPFKVCF